MDLIYQAQALSDENGDEDEDEEEDFYVTLRVRQTIILE